MDFTLISSAIYILGTLMVRFLSWLINQIYALILLLADVDLYSIFGDDIRKNFFALIGLFMVFKLAFSVIQYIIDPDKMTNSSAGAQKILVRVVIALALLGSINKIFEEAHEIQRLVLDRHVLDKLIFGEGGHDIVTENNGDANSSDMSKDPNARYLSYAIFAPFVRFNNDAFSTKTEQVDCAPGVFMESIGKPGRGEYTCTSKCCTDFQKEAKEDLKAFKARIELHDIGGAMMKVIALKKNKKMIFEFDWFIAVIVGVVAAVTLVVISINVAIRAIKLALLQLVAPLPIISYIDINDKNNMFQKWLKLVISTYVDLFVRLFSFYFAIMIITKVLIVDSIPSFSGTKYTFKDHPIVLIFLIIGALLFAGQLPKILQDLFGYNGDGPTKGFVKKGLTALGAGAIGGVGGAISGTIAANSRMRSKIAEINGNSSLTDAQKRTARAKAQFGILGRSILETQSAKFGATVGALKGKGGFTSAFSAAGAGIKTAAIRRNASYVTYTDPKGKTKSAYGIGSNMRKSFADMIGIDDKNSGRERLAQIKKDAENQQKIFEREHSIALSELEAERQRMYSVRDDVVSSEDVSGDFFETVVGSEAATTGEAVIYKISTDSSGEKVLNTETKKMTDFTKADYDKNVAALSDFKRQELTKAGKTASEVASLVSDFENSLMIGDSSFNRMKAASINYKGSIDKERHTYNNLQTQQRAVRTADKNLNKVDKALK